MRELIGRRMSRRSFDRLRAHLVFCVLDVSGPGYSPRRCGWDGNTGTDRQPARVVPTFTFLFRCRRSHPHSLVLARSTDVQTGAVVPARLEHGSLGLTSHSDRSASLVCFGSL